MYSNHGQIDWADTDDRCAFCNKDQSNSVFDGNLRIAYLCRMTSEINISIPIDNYQVSWAMYVPLGKLNSSNMIDMYWVPKRHNGYSAIVFPHRICPFWFNVNTSIRLYRHQIKYEIRQHSTGHHPLYSIVNELHWGQSRSGKEPASRQWNNLLFIVVTLGKHSNGLSQTSSQEYIQSHEDWKERIEPPEYEWMNGVGGGILWQW